MCVFCCKASIAPPSASNAFPKSAAYLIFVNKVEYGFKQCKTHCNYKS